MAPLAGAVLARCASALCGLRQLCLPAGALCSLRLGHLGSEAGMAPAQLLRFSTEMLPPRDRMSAFREQFVRQVVNMDLIDRTDGQPQIDIALLRFGPVKVG